MIAISFYNEKKKTMAMRSQVVTLSQDYMCVNGLCDVISDSIQTKLSCGNSSLTSQPHVETMIKLPW